MDVPWGHDLTKKFVKNVGLITSHGKFGPNIMAAEWTYQVSYSPGLIAVSLKPSDATHENIRSTREFGVSIAATDQTVLSSLAGGASARDTEKIAALEELGFTFRKAKKIACPMPEGAAAFFECKLVSEHKVGDHTLFVGEVLEAGLGEGKEPLAYYQGQYGHVVLDMPKPTQAERESFAAVMGKHRKEAET